MAVAIWVAQKLASELRIEQGGTTERQRSQNVRVQRVRGVSVRLRVRSAYVEIMYQSSKRRPRPQTSSHAPAAAVGELPEKERHPTWVAGVTGVGEKVRLARIRTGS